MGTRGTQQSLCCHPLFSTGALWCPSTHIRYGRPGAKEPHAESPSPPLQPPFFELQHALLISAGLSPPPGLLCLPSHICSLHLLPLSSGCDRPPRYPIACCQHRGSAKQGSAEMRNLLVADLLTQLRWHGQCLSAPCSTVSAHLRYS